MAEELLVKCRKCGLVYDKLKNRACPKCEPRVRPGTVAAPEPSPAPPSPPAATTSTTAAPASSREARTGRAGGLKIWLALAIGVGTGFAGSRVVGSRDSHAPVLLPLPEPVAPTSAPATGTPTDKPRETAGVAPLPANGPAPTMAPGPVSEGVVVGADGKPPAHPVELLDARRGPPREDGTLEYTVVLVNRTTNTLKEVRVRGVGEDKKGNRVVTQEVQVDAPLVAGGRETTARLLVPEGTVLNEYAVAAWVQHGALVRLEPPPPEPPEARRRRPFPPSTVPEAEPADAPPEAPAPAAPPDDGAADR